MSESFGLVRSCFRDPPPFGLTLIGLPENFQLDLSYLDLDYLHLDLGSLGSSGEDKYNDKDKYKDKYKDKDKVKVQKILDICYIFEKQRVQGYQIWYFYHDDADKD